MNSFFITGTDTDAGKTHVGQSILLAGRARGLRVAGFKPIETGCPEQDTPGADALALGSAAGHPPITTYTFTPPIAPHIAANRANVTISSKVVLEKARTLNPFDLLLLEGAGGFLVPISASETMADLASLLRLPIVIVAPNRLGAMNHSLLTIEAARRRDLRIAALVLSELNPGSGAGLENASLSQLGNVPVYEFPHTSSIHEQTQAGEELLSILLD